jgi:LmbE family N-acetylglucosaminyl deacetylase
VSGASPLTERLGLPADRAPRVFVVSAHADDAEIGAGGTILRLLDERPDAQVSWLVLAADIPERAEEARRSADRLLAGAATRGVDVRDLRDGFLPFLGSAPKDVLLEHSGDDPDLILAPRRDDAHQDHRLASELVYQVFRRPAVLEYEVPKWDGDLGQANLYVPLGNDLVERKIGHLLEAFPSQAGRAWFARETFEAILRLRGVESRAPAGTAEAFVCRKLIV